MVGMLQAIPTTPLYERLKQEGRLVEEDPNCNFVPKQMSREELRQGYWDLVSRLYTPEAFLDRYFKVYESPEYLQRRAAICKKAGEGKHWPTLGYGLALLWSLFWALLRDGSLTSVGTGLPEVLLHPQHQVPTRHHRLRAVHEPLRDTLALLQVHPRGDRRPAADVQQCVIPLCAMSWSSRRTLSTSEYTASAKGWFAGHRPGSSRQPQRHPSQSRRTTIPAFELSFEL